MENVIKGILKYDCTYDEETIKNLKNDFSRLEGQCYLDHAGATLYSDTQLKRVSDELHKTIYANPHSVGIASGITHNNIERIRHSILNHFHTSSDEYTVIFTSGATAALKLIAETFIFKKDKKDTCESLGYFVYTQDNHTSVLGMREVVAHRGAEVVCLSHNDTLKFLQQPTIASNNNVVYNNNALFVYPAQCNFSGFKYPLKWIEHVHNSALSIVTGHSSTKWYVLLDAAAFVSTNDLNLSLFKPDFVSISFYKMFGYPTGIGALLVKNSSADVLQKLYYGGGTIEVSLSAEMFHVMRRNLYQRFEDGTVSFLSIVSLQYGLDILSTITMKKISNHVFSLARYLYYSLLMLYHHNDKPAIKIYSDSDYNNSNLQGGIVTFNVLRSNGEYVGYIEVANMAALFNIHLRTGCFCNPGACQRHLNLSNEEVLQNYDAGYVCGGSTDLVAGKPTGAVRISFGYMSTIQDVETLLRMILKCFLSGPTFPIRNGTEENSRHSTILTEIKSNESFKTIILKKLFVYPIKSCGAFEVTTSWCLNAKGLEYDREWMIITSTGVCLTQKQQTNLCLIKPFIDKKRQVMKLTYPGMPFIEIPLNNSSDKYISGKICQTKICEQKVQGTEYAGDVSEWLSLVLGRPNLKLVRQSTHKNMKDTPALSFSSQAQYLLLNQASILWLSDRIRDTTGFEKESILLRFRGNILLSGCKAFKETKWKTVRIGNNEFVVNGPCTRCQMICIDQRTGMKTIEPLRTLAEEFHGKVKFGIYLTRKTVTEDVLKIGDIVNYT